MGLYETADEGGSDAEYRLCGKSIEERCEYVVGECTVLLYEAMRELLTS